MTSCLQCTRRKQKCDRQTPCQRCVKRGVTGDCIYEADCDINVHDERAKRSRLRSSEESSHQDSNPEYSLLSENIGYSQQGDSAFSAFRQLLDEEDIPSPNTATEGSSANFDKQSKIHRLINVLPCTGDVQKLIEIFFAEANWYFAVLDRHFFDVLNVKWIAFCSKLRNQGGTSLELLYFLALLLQVVALAMQFLPPRHGLGTFLETTTQEGQELLSKKFSEAGSTLMEVLEQLQPTITSVQADLMRCTWLKNNGQGTTAWHSLGHAIRQAQDLGLHLEPRHTLDDTNIAPEALQALWLGEHRRRLWITLFIWESHMSLQLGRPRMINASDCTIRDPIDCDFPLEPSQTVLMRTSCADRPSSFTLQLVKYKIGQLIHRMMSVKMDKSLARDHQDVQLLHDEVLAMLEGLPPAARIEKPDTTWDLVVTGLVKQRLQISIVVHSFLIALHRPQASANPTSRRLSIEAAMRSLDASHELFEISQPHHHKIYTLVFHTIDAGIFLAVMAIKNQMLAPETHRRLVLILEQAMGRLKVLKVRNAAARHGEKVLNKCLQIIDHTCAARIRTEEAENPEAGPLTNFTVAKRQSPTLTTLDKSFLNDIRAMSPIIEQDERSTQDIPAMMPTSLWLEHMDATASASLDLYDIDDAWAFLFRTESA